MSQYLKHLRPAFTLVELMIVIVILGILASVVFTGVGDWRGRTARTEVKSDASAVTSGMENVKNWSNGYPVFPTGTVFDGSNDTKNVFVQSSNVKITYSSGDSTSYCVNIESLDVASVKQHISMTGGTSQTLDGDCTAPVVVIANYSSASNSGSATTVDCTSQTGPCAYLFIDLSSWDTNIQAGGVGRISLDYGCSGMESSCNYINNTVSSSSPDLLLSFFENSGWSQSLSDPEDYQSGTSGSDTIYVKLDGSAHQNLYTISLTSIASTGTTKVNGSGYKILLTKQ